jgi:hypothetical protein
MVAAAQALTFRHWRSFSDSWTAEVAVRAGKDESTYAVREECRLPSGARVFSVLKAGGLVPYAVRLYPRGHSCDCKGASYRHQRADCRHYQIVSHLLSSGVL